MNGVGNLVEIRPAHAAAAGQPYLSTIPAMPMVFNQGAMSWLSWSIAGC
jgi:hypothetical protein